MTKPYSEKTSEIIDEEVKLMVEKSYQRTLGIIRENKDKLIILAEKLLEKEVLFRDDLELIFGKSKFEDELKEEKKISKKKEVNTPGVSNEKPETKDTEPTPDKKEEKVDTNTPSEEKS